jgi:hypothetical protein
MHVDIYLFIYLFTIYLSTPASLSEPMTPNVQVITNKFTGKPEQEGGRGLFEVLVDIRLQRLKKSKQNMY